MKTLILVRHAKSDWPINGQDDFERPLSERGKRDARMMADRLWDKGTNINLIITSPARRARKTAKAFAERYGLEGSGTIESKQLYLADAREIAEVVAGIPDDSTSVALFSHNPGITIYINSLGVVRLDEMPTCGIVAVTCDVSTWSAFEQAEKSFLFFDRPKAH